MGTKQKLELTWVRKDARPKLEPRILIEDPELSYHADKRYSENDKFDNILIQGDNLLALKVLEQKYAGLVKCIYIDPPYNTGNAFEHYDDGLKHSIWLGLMRNRLEILRTLLSDEGTVFVQIDDNEYAYLKVLMDEIFGRDNFINTVSVNMKNIAGASGGGEDKKLKKNVEFLLIYAKSYDHLIPFQNVFDYIPVSELIETYRDEGKSWKYTTVLKSEGEKEYLASTVDGNGDEIKIFKRKNFEICSIKQVMETEKLTEDEAYKRYAKQVFQTAMPQSSIRPRVIAKVSEVGTDTDLHSIEYIPKSGKNKGSVYEQFYKGENFRLFAWLRDVAEERDGVLYKKEMQGTYWDFAKETKNLTKEGGCSFPNGKKPESLIARILELASNSGDIVLDSFGGSGTTATVAHKMGRRWITVEIGDHAQTHIVPRLKKVIDGQDSGGVTDVTGWKGGGGYRFYRLAPSLLEKDPFGNWVISKDYDANMLSAAICKVMGFTYSPSDKDYWNHGYSTESDFIFVTTNAMTHDALVALSNEVGPDRSLMVCCKAFNSDPDFFDNLTLKKIPNAVMDKCEWGKDDYSLNVENLPMFEVEEDEDDPDLFDVMDDSDV